MLLIYNVLLLLQKRQVHSRGGPVPACTSYKKSGSVTRVMASSTLGSRAGFASKTSVDDPIVSVNWLHENLKDPNLKVNVSLLEIRHLLFVTFRFYVFAYHSFLLSYSGVGFILVHA